MMNPVRTALLLTFPFWLMACGTTPVQPVQPAPPAGWEYGQGVTDAWPARDWWRGFASTELDALMQQAQANNPDLNAAAARILQAEAQARIAGASLLPNVDAGLDAGRSGIVDQGGGSASYSASLGASYELDFWGANRAQRAGARAALAATAYDRETVALTLTAGVANSYLQVLSLQERLEIARLNLALAEEILRVVEARVSSGAGTPLDLARQRAVVARQRASVQPLLQQERDARATLALLLGQVPQGLAVEGQLADMLIPQVMAGLPAELLVRRPDIRQQEARLLAADADIAVARAAFFPSVRLTGAVGTRSDMFSELFSGDLLYNLGASLTQPIFNAGRLRAQRDLSEARKLELLALYRGAIQQAFAEVDLSLSNIETLAEQAFQQDIELTQTRRAFTLAEARYREGADDLLTLLDAQQSLYQAEENNGLLRLAQMQAIVTLYRVLGGGWSEAEQTSAR
ncbi:efflux transporter outer membrane subunit [Alcanivorax sp. JB21]|uniref:efflux transporter outer membrane subunit n=1 Tax=Alcanivorax limicola TaxID=2874102 RepID=UPI001CBEB2D1|nr:efflux transporter outer membrane subunit [Alcanivorax limicola]MBZ2187567.1 efflux transporter outer membrane subunit [Alcanivorax limicola]